MENTQQDKIKLIRFLNFVCTLEASKPIEEIDGELIDACVTVLLNLQDKHVELSPEYIDNQVRKIFHPEDTETAEPETVKVPKKVVSKKKIWLVAACIAILVALFSIISFSSERTVVDVLEDFLGTYEFIPFGKEVDVGGNTYGKGSKSRRYDSVEEAVNNEKIDLMFPYNEINPYELEIIIFYSKQDKQHIAFDFVNNTFSINIDLNNRMNDTLVNNCTEKITIKNITYYLYIMNDSQQAQAYFMHNNNLYTVTCPDRNSLIDILENMEEVKYED